MLQKYISRILSCTILVSSLCGAVPVEVATKALFDALKKNDEQGVYKALEDGASVSETTYDEFLGFEGLTVLHYGVYTSAKILKLFLERGAPVNARAENGQGTALHAILFCYAEMAFGYYSEMLNFTGKIDMTKLPATENGVELVRRGAIEFHNETIDKIALLISDGADVNLKAHGVSPLDMAEQMGAQALIKIMKK